jgi:hypothetical protein
MVLDKAGETVGWPVQTRWSLFLTFISIYLATCLAAMKLLYLSDVKRSRLSAALSLGFGCTAGTL